MRTIKNFFIRHIFKIYLPFLGAGVKVRLPNDDFSEFKVSMKLTVFNQNYVGVHFGGSLYSMCDPFFMLILMHKLGEKYIVWDKSASINFIRPGKSTVFAHFKIDDSEVEMIKKQVEEHGKYEPVFDAYILDENGKNIAAVSKRLWVKKK